MEATKYVNLIAKNAAISPREEIEWLKLPPRNFGIKLKNQMLPRKITSIYLGIYGFGFESKKGALISSDLTRQTWAWDEIQFVSRYNERITNLEGIRTNVIDIMGEGPNSELFIDDLYLKLSWHSSLACWLIGENVPRINTPIDDNLIASCNYPSHAFKNGYPSFDRLDRSLEMKGILDVLASRNNNNFKADLPPN